MQPDPLLRQPQLFCDRVWLLATKQVTPQEKTMQWFRLGMPSSEFSCACDVLPAKVLLQATRPGWAIELAQHKR